MGDCQEHSLRRDRAPWWRRAATAVRALLPRRRDMSAFRYADVAGIDPKLNDPLVEYLWGCQIGFDVARPSQGVTVDRVVVFGDYASERRRDPAAESRGDGGDGNGR